MQNYSYETLIKILQKLEVQFTQTELIDVVRELGYPLSRMMISIKKRNGSFDGGHTRDGGSQAVFYTIEDIYKILGTYKPKGSHQKIAMAIEKVTGVDHRYVSIKQDKLKRKYK